MLVGNIVHYTRCQVIGAHSNISNKYMFYICLYTTLAQCTLFIVYLCDFFVHKPWLCIYTHVQYATGHAKLKL
jgi:hypothetical protein